MFSCWKMRGVSLRGASCPSVRRDSGSDCMANRSKRPPEKWWATGGKWRDWRFSVTS